MKNARAIHTIRCGIILNLRNGGYKFADIAAVFNITKEEARQHHARGKYIHSQALLCLADEDDWKAIQQTQR